MKRPMDCYVKSNGKKHLVIVGGGSAAFSAAIRASELDAQVTLINDGLPIGGTCVNVGCVPSKTLIRAAEAHYRTGHHNFQGITGHSQMADFGAIVAQKRELVEELRQGKYVDIISGLENVRHVDGHAKIVSPRAVGVNGEQITADRILIATGVSPSAPPIPGLQEVPYLTNESLFELEELPKSLIVLGAGYVALESAQMFARFGSRVTILQRSSRILKSEDPDITNALTGYLEQEGLEVVTGAAVRNTPGGKNNE